VLVLGRAQQLAVGRYHIDREEVVDRKAVLAHQPADATAESEPGDTGVVIRFEFAIREGSIQLKIFAHIKPVSRP
jgi:hypothetical protein